jgi:hypothetical protein
MKTTKLLVLFFIYSLIQAVSANAAEHHSGHGGGPKSGGARASMCLKAHLSKFMPPHMATVRPEAEFSFVAFNIDDPEQLVVTVKKIPVEVNAEFKDPYYLVKGKLPASLVNTVARVNVKVDAKSSHCEAENGWLLKISDK